MTDSNYFLIISISALVIGLMVTAIKGESANNESESYEEEEILPMMDPSTTYSSEFEMNSLEQNLYEEKGAVVAKGFPITNQRIVHLRSIHLLTPEKMEAALTDMKRVIEDEDSKDDYPYKEKNVTQMRLVLLQERGLWVDCDWVRPIPSNLPPPLDFLKLSEKFCTPTELEFVLKSTEPILQTNTNNNTV